MRTETALSVPGFVAGWFENLEPLPLAEAAPFPSEAAIFCADMVSGFCRAGALASERVGALADPVAALFRRAYAHGIRDFVLAQDTHHERAPEFDAFPPHCLAGTDEARTIPELSALPFARDFTIVEKNSLHPGLGTPFDRWLDDHPRIRTAIVCGNCTDLCVYQLAMHLRLRANALDIRDVNVIVPADCAQTYDLDEDTASAVGAPAHPGDFFHAVFLYHLALNGVRVVREIE